MIGAGLSGVYTFLYITFRQQDYALLMGAIALFIVLAIVMYVRRKVDWYVRDAGSVSARGIEPMQIDTSGAVLYHAAFIRPNRYPEVWLNFPSNSVLSGMAVTLPASAK